LRLAFFNLELEYILAINAKLLSAGVSTRSCN
jgi:hypothetical protein